MRTLYRLRRAVLLILSAFPVAAQPAARPQAGSANGLPDWLDMGVEFRGRYEGGTANNYSEDSTDFYYLHRIRAHIAVHPKPWVTLFIQPQNTEVLERGGPVPANLADRFDFHQAYADFAGTGDRKWRLRAGRQEINFGQQRLVGSANWGNVSRSYDALRVSQETRRYRADWFASTVVRPDRTRLDAFTKDVQLHGFHLSANGLPGRGLLETYFLWKIDPREANETGAPGRTSLWTAGARAEARLPRRFDYNLETAVQGGRSGGDPHRAWAGYYTLGYRINHAERSPRLFCAYTYASGDGRRGDRHHGTFDQLFPTNHAFYGWADRHGWRNLHEAMGGLVWRPDAKWTVNFEYHSFWLASRDDAFYNFGGRAQARNPNATSSHIDQELDVNAVWNASRQLQFIFGLGHLFPGGFLKQATGGVPATVSYLQWRYTM